MTARNAAGYRPAVIATVRRAVYGVLLSLLAAPAARAQDTGTYFSAALDPGSAPAWVDFDADGKADFCRIVGGGFTGHATCTVSTGRGFGATYASGNIDAGYGDGRTWGDVNGDHRADYCRRVGNGGADSRIACSLSSGSGFVEAGNTLQGWGVNETLADATADGSADYCRITGANPYAATCSPSASGNPFSAAVDPGSPYGRAFVDFTGDGKADFCRVTSVLACLISTGSGFGGDISSLALDRGYEPGRAWTDVNGDGKADYCRRIGNGGADARIGCTLSTGTGFGQNFISEPLEWGVEAGAAWADFDGDGDKDFCRPVAPTPTSQQLFCTLWTPNGLANTIVSGPTDLGADGGRAWVDHNGDGKADYCRIVDTRVACTISNGSAFGPLPGPPPPPATPQPPILIKPIPRILVTLAYEYRTHGRYTRLSWLIVNRIPKGATVEATCRTGCSRKSYTRRNVRGGRLSLKPLIRRRLRAGTTIRIVVSQAGKRSATKTLRIRSGRRPLLR